MPDYKSPLPVKTNPGDSVDANVQGVSTGTFAPEGASDLALGEKAPLRLDAAGNLITRSTVLTDEGSFYEPFAGTSLSSNWGTLIGTGSTIAVADSKCTIVTGITAGIETAIFRVTDYPPLTLFFVISISQRIVNQDIFYQALNIFWWGGNVSANSNIFTFFAKTAGDIVINSPDQHLVNK